LPQCLISADDWTKEMASKGFPQLQEMYKLLGAPEAVKHHPFLHFQHNYNYVSRAAMYAWMNAQFRLGLPTPVVEEDYPRLSAKELGVWDEAHPRPAGGDDVERGLLAWWTAQTKARLAATAPRDAASLQAYRDLAGRGWNAIVGRGVPGAGEVTFAETGRGTVGGAQCVNGLVRHAARGEELPVVLLGPGAAGAKVALVLHRDGKAGLFQADGTLRPEVRRLVDAGVAVVGADLLFQGEFLADGKPVTQTRRVKNPREAAAYTFGYNHALFAQRVHDILTVVGYLEGGDLHPAEVWLVGLEGANPWAAVALGRTAGAVARAAIDTAGFRFAAVTDIHSPDFLPGGARYDDLPGALATGAPCPLWLAGEGAEDPGLVRDAYRAAGAEASLRCAAATGPDATAAAVDWLLGR
jgi:hypothetical protein